MELSIRDWLLVVGVLMLLFVVYDGFKRSQKERKNRVRVSKQAKQRAKQARLNKDSDQQDDFIMGEQSRVVNADLGISSASSLNVTTTKQSKENSIEESPLASVTAVAEDAAVVINSSPSTPKMSTSLSDEIVDNKNASAAEEQLDATVDNQIEGQASSTMDNTGEVDPLFENPFEVDAARLQKTTAHNQSVLSSQALSEHGMREEHSHAEFQHSLAFDSHRDEEPEFDEILVLSIVANEEQGFSGEDLFQVLKACDCRPSERKIFQRFEGENGQGKVQFSIVNMLEPGTFDMDNISETSTAGVSFFLRLPGPSNPVEAYDCMAELAQYLARTLNGILKDEVHSAATEQTIAHNRQRILDYQQRKLLSA